jgi:CO/xanthine dehydrogenase FAD-binding subunit
MTPGAFRYARPGSVSATVSLLRPGAQLLAGGQSMVPLLVRRAARPDLVIDINRIPGLADIEITGDAVRMGALVRLEQARCCELVRSELAVVAAALAWVANPVVRRRGTVVGNLVMNAPGAELPAVAAALGAEFLVRTQDGQTLTIAAHQAVPDTAMVTHVLWPRQAGPGGFFEVSRRDGHGGVVGAAVSRRGDEVRVGVSGVCAAGLAANAVAQVIAGAHPEPPDRSALARALREDIGSRPIHGDLQAGPTYRLEVAPEVIRRAAQSMREGRD